MFCPECDRVYLKAKVCPHCGVKLLRATGKPETKNNSQRKTNNTAATGMRCPECGSDNWYSSLLLRHVDSSNLIIVILKALVLLYYLIQGKTREYYCRDCGHRWTR